MKGKRYLWFIAIGFEKMVPGETRNATMMARELLFEPVSKFLSSKHSVEDKRMRGAATR